jgi:Uma2 family endonuclease
MGMPAVERRWTAADVRALRDANPLPSPRYELVDGELLVTPSPRGPHQFAVTYLVEALTAYLRSNPIGEVLTSPFDVEVEPGFLAQPDVFVVPLHEARRLRTDLPAKELLVAAEVLSPSSLRHDRVTKRGPYQRNVQEYWIVDVDTRLIERWQSTDERPRLVTDVLEWHPALARETFVLDLPAYFARVFGEP